jgi:hypothetical protein
MITVAVVLQAFRVICLLLVLKYQALQSVTSLI